MLDQALTNTRIFFDLSELYLLSRGRLKFYGIASVVAELAAAIAQGYPDVVFVIHDQTSRCFLRVTPVFDAQLGLVSLNLPGRAVPYRLQSVSPYKSLGLRVGARLLNMPLRGLNRVKALFRPHGTSPVDLRNGVFISAARPKLIAEMLPDLPERTRLYTLLHDAIPLHDYGENPSRVKRDFRDDTAKVLHRSFHIFANSRFTLLDLQRMAQTGFLPPLPQSSVTRLAHECRDATHACTIEMPNRPYVLGVGLTLGRKNLNLVLNAQKLMVDKGQVPPVLIVAGAVRKSMLKGLSAGNYPTAADHMILIDSPSQSDLVHLYKNARATIVPSRLEGWGLPVGESLWHGTPVMTTRLSSLPEVGGDLALYVDPDDPEDLARALATLSDETVYGEWKKRIADGQKSLRRWTQVAEEILTTVCQHQRLRLR